MATVPNYILLANQEGSKRINPLNDRSHDPNQDEYKRLMDHVKKQKRRIERYSALIKGVENEGNASLFSETRAKILKCEKILASTLEKIRYRQSVKDKVDRTEAKKRENKRQVENLEKVRLERSKLVDYVPQEVEEGEPVQDHRLTIYTEAKGSTAKNPLFVETTKEEIRKKFFEKVGKATPKRRNTKKMTVAEKIRRKGQVYLRNNPDCPMMSKYINQDPAA